MDQIDKMLEERRSALVKHLQLEEDAYSLEVSEYEPNQFILGDEEYLVVIKEEALDKAFKYVEETLWAFNVIYLVDFMACVDSMLTQERSQFIKTLEIMQRELCEDANLIMIALVGIRVNQFFNAVIANGGIAHYINSYDGCEHEVDGYFIYRLN